MNFEINGRKRKRYNIFRVFYNFVSFKRIFTRYLKANFSRISYDNLFSLSDILVLINVNLIVEG